MSKTAERGNMKASSHSIEPDWCHLCGYRERDTADIWYPRNAEHGGPKSEYVRICMECADRIAEVADRRHRSRNSTGSDRWPEVLDLASAVCDASAGETYVLADRLRDRLRVLSLRDVEV